MDGQSWFKDLALERALVRAAAAKTFFQRQHSTNSISQKWHTTNPESSHGEIAMS